MRVLWRDRRANVAIIVGLLALPLLGAVSLAVDFGNAVTARAKLDSAADSAALLATTVASNQFQAGASNAAASGQAAATQRFNGVAGAIAQVTLSAVTVAVTQSGSTFTSSVTYTGGYQTMLGKIVGVGTIALHGASGSSLAVNPYVDIQVLMDVSSSMTIAATQNDINNLQVLTANYNPPGVLPSNVVKGEPCGFACHWSSTGNDYLALARANGVQLRIDVLSAAVGNLITTITGLNKNSDFRLGLTTFAQQFSQIYLTSTNIAGAAGALAKIAPDINDCSSNCPETYFANAMTNLGLITTASGNGASQATSQKFLFIVTDGLVDQYTGANRGDRPGHAVKLQCAEGDRRHYSDALHAVHAVAGQRVLQPVRGAHPIADRAATAGLRLLAQPGIPGDSVQPDRHAASGDAGRGAANLRPPHAVRQLLGRDHGWLAVLLAQDVDRRVRVVVRVRGVGAAEQGGHGGRGQRRLDRFRRVGAGAANGVHRQQHRLIDKERALRGGEAGMRAVGGD